MKITPDTNVLVRLLAKDDEAQNRTATEVLDQADGVVLTLPALCELVWVLRRGYGSAPRDIAMALRALLDRPTVIFDRAPAEAGLTALEDGGDFADAVIAHEGRRLGAEAFVSFDRAAVRRLEARGEPVQLLS